MARAAASSATAVSAADYLDFLMDGPGWESVGASGGVFCASGGVHGHRTLAAVVGDTSVPLSAEVLNALSHLVDREPGSPLVLIVKPYEVADDGGQTGALSRLLAALARRRRHSAVIVVVLGELVGHAAILARMADIVCFGPGASLALADAKTSKRISSPYGAGIPAGLLTRTFKTDAAALLSARSIVNRLPGQKPSSPKPFSIEPADLAFENLAGSNTARHVDGSRLLQRIADDRTFVEFDGLGGLTAFLADIGGRTVGVLASRATLSGALDATALAQADALVALCGRHSLAILTLIDCPGVVPDDPALGALANLISAWEDAQVLVVSLVVRKAIGAAPAALVPASAISLYWPEAKVGLLNASAGTPESRCIAPRETRAAIIKALESLREPAV
jgi:propionyl-CoA carboxylase beta chain